MPEVAPVITAVLIFLLYFKTFRYSNQCHTCQNPKLPADTAIDIYPIIKKTINTILAVIMMSLNLYEIFFDIAGCPETATYGTPLIKPEQLLRYIFPQWAIYRLI